MSDSIVYSNLMTNLDFRPFRGGSNPTLPDQTLQSPVGGRHRPVGG